MIEIKLSQGAKPGHGGMLMAPKVTQRLLKPRVFQFTKIVSHHHIILSFSTPDELLNFADKLRKLSGGKPVGIKLCIGHPWEFIAIVKSMVDSGRSLIL